MEPHFPLRNTPQCRECGLPCTREIVTPRNPIGNLGRPYYACNNPRHERAFSTWDDYGGIANGNPRCKCRFTSRRDTNRNGVDFYACPNRFNRGCGLTETCAEALALQPNSITVAGTVPQHVPQHFPQHFPQHVPQYAPPYAPQYAPQYVPQYGYPRPEDYAEVPVRGGCRSCCLVM